MESSNGCIFDKALEHQITSKKKQTREAMGNNTLILKPGIPKFTLFMIDKKYHDGFGTAPGYARYPLWD